MGMAINNFDGINEIIWFWDFNLCLSHTYTKTEIVNKRAWKTSQSVKTIQGSSSCAIITTTKINFYHFTAFWDGTLKMWVGLLVVDLIGIKKKQQQQHWCGMSEMNYFMRMNPKNLVFTLYNFVVHLFFWPHFIKLFLVQFATACHLPRILFKLAWPVILLTIFKRLLSGNKRLSQQNYFFSAIHSSPFHSYFGVFFPLFFFCYCYCCRWFACIQTWHFYCFFSYKL